MRIALVSPYSWTYPGGVTRHIEALAEQYLDEGHDVRVLAPYDPPGPHSTIAHRGAHPQRAATPEYLISLGRTVGFKANGAVSNLSISGAGVVKLTKELQHGNYDVAHVHEPVAPLVGWTAAQQWDLPLVGTFHSYSNKWLPNTIGNAFGASQVLNHLHQRIAVSEAAAWTGKRWFGGRYRVIPNGVHIDQDVLEEALRAHASRALDAPLKMLFIGQSVERKGLPLLLRAFEALREHIPTELTVIGPTQDEMAPMLMDSTGVRALGKVDDETKRIELEAAEVLVAPSLGGESFGMVLTEGMAHGTTVVASDIAGYRDVVTDGVDGVLTIPGDAQGLAETLRELYHEPLRRRALAEEAAKTVQRFEWRHVAAEVMESYVDAIAAPHPQTTKETVAVRLGIQPADMLPKIRARKVPSLEHQMPVTRRKRVFGIVRRVGVTLAMLAGVYLAYLALKKIGISNIGNALVTSQPAYVLLGLAAMCSAMAMRAVSWHAILKAALPKSRVTMMTSLQGTMIGVLMSSTLPARLGEPARAIVVSRRTGRPRDHLPVVLGTVVSQTILNIIALIILGVVMFSSVDFFAGHQSALLFVAIAPAALLAFVLIAPIMLKYGPGGTRFARARKAMQNIQGALGRVRTGLAVFKIPGLGAQAFFAQMLAWGLQALACYFLLCAMGLTSEANFGAAAAVLFAVNVTAVLPATPANLGVFQAACATVLHTGWHVSYSTGVAYGVILQAVEVATAILMGMPALLKEGMSWKEVRLRAMHSAPIKLPPRPNVPHFRSGKRETVDVDG
jgi:phosphatidyl-myo-inositol alpha-mannosyltransferase